MVDSVPTGGDSAECLVAGYIQDTVHYLVVDAIAAHRDDQRRSCRRNAAGQLTGLTRVLGRPQHDRQIGQS